MPNRRPQLEIVAPGAASPEEAAAVVAAVERFLRDHAPVMVAAPARPNAWLRAALLEGTGREPDGPSPWGDPVPWGTVAWRAPTRHVDTGRGEGVESAGAGRRPHERPDRRPPTDTRRATP